MATVTRAFRQLDADRDIETITGAKALTASDCGKTFILKAATGAEITLPAAFSGFNCKFIVGLDFITTAWTVVAPTKKIQGTVIVNGASVLGENEDIITFAFAAETIGDHVELISDGTDYFVSGVASAAAGITLTAS